MQLMEKMQILINEIFFWLQKDKVTKFPLDR